jgi:hypothetical protein
MAMILMIFLLGTLLGMLAGAAVCVRYLRQEIAGDIGPKLRRIQFQLENLEAEINLVMATRLAESSRRYGQDPPLPPSR